ncbi:MAG: RHS repeat-associated core domain-containing protein [Pseudomonas sp.]|nr:RHS repeat-associated core domain-containing protein [Pseudomonas sp.]
MSKIFTPVILSVDGYHEVTLEWVVVEHAIGRELYSQVRLSSISDASRKLVALDYDSDLSVKINFWPDDESQKLTYTLGVSDYKLDTVIAADESVTTLNYEDHSTCGWLLNGITGFEGVTDAVTYGDGIDFPDNEKLSVLPSAHVHVVTTRNKSAVITTRYDYVRSNDGSYQTTLVVGAEEHECTTVYSYSKDHQLLKEEKKQGEAVVLTCYETNADKYIVTTTHQLGDSKHEAKVETHFDKAGTLNRTIKNGVVTYYQNSTGEVCKRYAALPEKQLVEGAKLKFADLVAGVCGFNAGLFKGRKFSAKYTLVETVGKPLDDLTVEADDLTVEADDCGEMYTVSVNALFKAYQYVAVPGLGGLKVGGVLSAVSANGKGLDAALIRQRISYYKGDDFRKGRQRNIEQGRVLGWDYLLDCGAWTKQSFEYTLKGASLTTKTRSSCSFRSGFDNIFSLTDTDTDTDTDTGPIRTCSETHSVLDGRLLSQIDEDGNESIFKYDEFGRLISHVACAQSTVYTQETTYAYPSSGRLVITEPDGRQHASEDDGLGNVTDEYERASAQGEWRQSLSTTYDELGRKKRTTRFDYLADGTQISEWCEYGYDDWNQECSQVYSSGQALFNVYDPVALTRREWAGLAADLHGKLTTYNDDLTVRSVEWKGADGKVYQTHTPTYTPTGQVSQVQVSGVHGEQTWRYSYDEMGRLMAKSPIEKGCRYLNSYSQDWLVSQPVKTSVCVGEYEEEWLQGDREFDEWGRVIFLTRGKVTERFTYKGASRWPSSKASGTQGANTLNYEYIKELGNKLGKVSLASDATQSKVFTYARSASATSTANEGDCKLVCEHDLHGHVKHQRAQTNADTEKSIKREYSPRGRLLSETDALGNQTSFGYNSIGQRDKTVCGELTTTHDYDAQGRLANETIVQAGTAGTTTVNVRFEYDDRGREKARYFDFPEATGNNLCITRDYYANDKLSNVLIHQGETLLGSKAMSYDAFDRLIGCDYVGCSQPQTPKGNAISKQAFTYNALDNVTSCLSTIGEVDCTSTYIYDEASGSCLETVTHDHADYIKEATLSYDDAGRVTQDQHGKKYSYDWLGRLIKAGSVHYSYDPMDRLMTRGKEGEGARQIFYDGLQVRGEYQPGDKAEDARYVCPGSAACTVQRVRKAGVDRIMFELRGIEGAVEVTYDATANTQVPHAYSVYGEHFSGEQASLLGFNGEYRDTDTDQYPLGHGYRWYAPDSLQFHAQDSLSPFGAGGPNAYGYCDGDPVNRHDPTGHIGSGRVNQALRDRWGDSTPAPLSLGPQGALLSAVIWGAIGVLTAVVSGGTSLILTAVLVGLAIAAAATAITAVVIADSNPELAEILRWVSLGLAIAGGVSAIAKKIGQLAVKLARSGQNLARKLFHKLSVAAVRRSNGLNAPKVAYRPSTAADFRRAGEVAESLAPINTRELAFFQFDTRAMVSESTLSKVWSGFMRHVEVDDVNTVVCAVTGYLGNSEYFDSEEDDSINGNINSLTNLCWGQLKFGH